MWDAYVEFTNTNYPISLLIKFSMLLLELLLVFQTSWVFVIHLQNISKCTYVNTSTNLGTLNFLRQSIIVKTFFYDAFIVLYIHQCIIIKALLMVCGGGGGEEVSCVTGWINLDSDIQCQHSEYLSHHRNVKSLKLYIKTKNRIESSLLYIFPLISNINHPYLFLKINLKGFCHALL